MASPPQVKSRPGLFPSYDYSVAITAGDYPSFSMVNIIGVCPTVSTVPTSITCESTVYPFLAQSSVGVKIASDSANDKTNSTGAGKVKIDYLVDGYTAASTIVSMNSSVAVAITASSCIRINGMTVSSAGSTGSNIGKIYCGVGTFTNGKPSTVLGTISSAVGRSFDGVYSVPAGFNLILTQAQIGLSSAASLQFDILTNLSNGSITTGFPKVSRFQGRTTNANAAVALPGILIPALSDIDLRGQMTSTLASTTAMVTLAVNGVLVDATI